MTLLSTFTLQHVHCYIGGVVIVNDSAWISFDFKFYESPNCNNKIARR